MTLVAHYALQELHIRPKEWITMHPREKAFIITSIETRIEELQKLRRR